MMKMSKADLEAYNDQYPEYWQAEDISKVEVARSYGGLYEPRFRGSEAKANRARASNDPEPQEISSGEETLSQHGAHIEADERQPKRKASRSWSAPDAEVETPTNEVVICPNPFCKAEHATGTMVCDKCQYQLPVDEPDWSTEVPP